MIETTPTMTTKNVTEKIDYCRKMPCLNNGECLNNESGFECICPALYTGK